MTDRHHKIVGATHDAPPLAPVPGACWVWERGVDSDGYGKITLDGKSMRVHRVMYELHVGPIPAGLYVDHLCRRRRCCNPSHLELVTNAENVLRGFSPFALNARKEVCVNGHTLDAANTYTRKREGRRPSRECRVCRTARMRTYDAAKRNGA